MINWDAVGAIGETLGALAVVITLIYLARQIKNQNREARIASVHEITEAFRTSIASLQDPERAKVYIAGLDEFDDLEDFKRMQFFSICQSLLRVWEEAYYQFKEGRLDQQQWDAMTANFSDGMSRRGFQRVWELRKHTYRGEFRDFVDNIEPGNYRTR